MRQLPGEIPFAFRHLWLRRYIADAAGVVEAHLAGIT